jgi:hypothetical protein
LPVGATLTVAVPSTLVLPAGTTAPKVFSICVYDTGAADALIVGAEADFTLTANATPDVSSGASGGGYPVTLTSTSAPFDDFNSAGHIVQFQAKVGSATGCAATAPGASAPTASNSTTMTGGVITVPTANVLVPTASEMNITVPAALTQPAISPPMVAADYFICVYNAAGTTLLAQNGSLFNLSGNAALSTSSGPSTGGNVVSITAGAPIFTSGQTAVVVQTAACGATYNSAAAGKVDVPNVRFISKNKLAATMPTSGLPGSTTAHNLCVYAGTSNGVSALVATAFGQYTVGQVPTITSVSPATGPAQGGTKITVTGTLFPTTPGALTATVAGEPLIDVQVANSTTFTAVTPPHAAGGPFPIAVTTVLGTQSTSGLFTYSNGIVVAPNTAPNTAMTPTDVDITGVGFSALKFSPTYSTNSTNAHVYLVKGVYSAGTTAAGPKPNGQTSECIDVLVITDTNLICSLYLGGNLNAAPTATTRTVTSCASMSDTVGTIPGTIVASTYLGPSSPTVTTCAFTQADVGMKITAGLAGAAIADNTTTIVSVSPTGVATLSKISTAPITSATTPITLSSSRTVADGTTTNGAKTLTSAAAPFSAGDVGKMVTGTNLPVGTYVVSVSGSTATLSNAATTSTSTGAYTIFTPAPVPEGTYTITVVSNGAPGAPASTTIPYTQSIISSGSTFTVSPY